MINLLPPDYKSDVSYARRNSVLRKWLVSLSLALFGSLLIIGGGYFYLDQAIKREEKAVQTERQKLEADDLEGTKKTLDNISNNTKLTIQVLSKEVLFSGLMRQLGATLPAGSALEKVQIDKIDGGITLRAQARNIQTATQVQVNLSDPNNKIFEKANIENINCTPSSTSESSIYPCSVQIKALFAKNNPYLYIQPSSSGGTTQ